MQSLGQIERMLPELTRGEKAQVLKWVAGDLNGDSPGIDSNPGVCGGSACIARTRIPVWTLVEGRRAGLSDGDLLRSFPSLRAEDLVNAWAYARSNVQEIERDIVENEAA